MCTVCRVLTGGGEVESEVYNSTSVQDGGGLHFTSLCTLFPCAQCALCVQSVELTGGGEVEIFSQTSLLHRFPPLSPQALNFSPF